MAFDDERGIVLDELPMNLYNSQIDGNSFSRSNNGRHYVKSNDNSEEIKRLNYYSKKVVEQYERKPYSNDQRMCGCETCVIF